MLCPDCSSPNLNRMLYDKDMIECLDCHEVFHEAELLTDPEEIDDEE